MPAGGPTRGGNRMTAATQPRGTGVFGARAGDGGMSAAPPRGCGARHDNRESTDSEWNRLIAGTRTVRPAVFSTNTQGTHSNPAVVTFRSR